MADDRLTDTNVVTRDETEPATKHDVTEGGVLGAVGGAVVGGLAGGPVGAVIGAIAGGAASAGAVDVVDKHDHDYDRTVANHNTTAMGVDRDTALGYAGASGADGRVANENATLSGLGTGTLGSSAATGGYSDYDMDFRNDYQTRYAGTDGVYDDYDPAYRYGHSLASDSRYQDQDWDTVQHSARSDWETQQPGTWDRFKGSVQHAYDRVKARV